MPIFTIKAQESTATSTVNLPPKHSLQLDFDAAEAAFDRVDDALVINFDNGGEVIVDNFFASNGAELPLLFLMTGQKFLATIFYTA